MSIRIIRQPLSTVDASWVAAGVFEKEPTPPSDLRGTGVEALAARLLAEKEVKGIVGETTAIHDPTGFKAPALLLFGLGPRPSLPEIVADDGAPTLVLDPEAKPWLGARSAFSAGVALSKKLAGKPRGRVAVSLAGLLEADRDDLVSALVEGLAVGMRGPGLFKAEADRHAFEFDLVAPEGTADEVVAELERLAARGEVVGVSVNMARMLVNTPPSYKPPGVIAEVIRKAAAARGVAVEVWDEPRIRAERFGGLLGVAAGSDQPPAFVTLEYKGAGDDAPFLAIVGKGVTFDSGGLSLKPTASMEDMKSDMTGAAVAAASITAAAQLKLPVNVRGYLAFTENMTGGRAMKLGDVLTMRNGKTVEVLNTDAEGRLILADALSYAAETDPARIIDLATLTGACMVALGTRIAGLFANDDDFADSLAVAAEAAGERVWRLPLDDDFKDALKSGVADLKNVGGRWGGASIAAKFLEQFVADVPWVHLDIAGPSWFDKENSVHDAGGSGCFVRTLVAYLERVAAN